MYHPSRGGVRGGRDQFKWEDVKVDKHRENYLGHSLMAPVGRWQKGKDLHWYTRGKSQQDMDAVKEEIKRIKEEEEQAMREALGLAPKRSNRPHGNRLDKHEYLELVKKGSTVEDLGAGHAEAAQVQGLGFSRAPSSWEASTSLPGTVNGGGMPEKLDASQLAVPLKSDRDISDDDSRKRRRHEESKAGRREERKHEKHEKRHSHGSEKRHHRSDKEKKIKKRHDYD